MRTHFDSRRIHYDVIFLKSSQEIPSVRVSARTVQLLDVE